MRFDVSGSFHVTHDGHDGGGHVCGATSVVDGRHEMVRNGARFACFSDIKRCIANRAFYMTETRVLIAGGGYTSCEICGIWL